MFFLGQNLSILPQVILILTYLAGITTVSLNLEKWVVDSHNSDNIRLLNEHPSHYYHIATSWYDLNKENSKVNKGQSGCFIPKRQVFVSGYHFWGHFHTVDRIGYSRFVKLLFSRPPPTHVN
jgi:hypothetical protein